ncbi:hypothetical protein SD70_19925 [Gordoniibacillus kamchatkensis]|uniref:Uncharacterized protein n=1 Tax=Gordoniibacillus kamchatkensis TaxID=1590651 RepID=A0ABR5AEH9_9BACL|nr:hypothetical protein [Paenibacillus sp. VKM B-2647]KIL39444.1 hypothetical protein SD70_19925 [Paenibacillus sp. VKM B-2647]
MKLRAIWMAALIALTMAGLLGKPAGTSADFMAQGPYSPDGLRIPGTIELLSDTAYYPAQDTPDDEPEGWFAPQTVKVIETYGAWSIGAANWKIETMFGPRWIRPKPWEIDIAPPERIVLLADTPLYGKKSERGGPVATLAPQEVEVAGAEKQWFYTNDPSSKAWIQIRTSWMGDLWAHIPVNQIGTIQAVNKTVYYNGLSGNKELEAAVHPERAKPDYATPGETRVIKQYTTIYDRYFLVETEQGPLWTWQNGVAIAPADETLDVAAEIPLFSEPANKELAVISGEKVAVFEKITQPLWYGRGPYEIWHFSSWYHVKTSKGTGWINLLYGEPADAVKVHWNISIHGDRMLMRYPGVPYTSSALLLRNQEADVNAVWTLPDGTIWLAVTAEGHKGWIPFHIWDQDRLLDLDAGTELQIQAQYPQQLAIQADSRGILTLDQDIRTGYAKEGVDVLNLKAVAEKLGYKETSADNERSAVRYGRGDYSFVLHNGKSSAEIYWKDVLEKTVALGSAPAQQEGEWYLRQPDVRQLFGLSPIPWSGHALYEGSYTVELGKLPAKITGGSAQLHAFLYDSQVSWKQKNLKDALQPRLTIEENNDLGGNGHASSIEIFPAGKPVTDDTVTQLYRLNASRPLAPGAHDLSLVLRVGERIVWKQLGMWTWSKMIRAKEEAGVPASSFMPSHKHDLLLENKSPLYHLVATNH